jgi:hypothetical protein
MSASKEAKPVNTAHARDLIRLNQHT